MRIYWLSFLLTKDFRIFSKPKVPNPGLHSGFLIHHLELALVRTQLNCQIQRKTNTYLAMFKRIKFNIIKHAEIKQYTFNAIYKVIYDVKLPSMCKAWCM